MALTGVEGKFEGGLQLVLQLFIVFKRADREPSNIQLMTLASSLMSCVVATIEDIFAHKPKTSIEVKASFIPYALITNIYSQMTAALIISTIQWNMIFIIIGVVVAWVGLAIICPCDIRKNFDKFGTSAKGLFIGNFIMFIA